MPPPFVLTVLKIAFLALLYFFVWRSVRAVVADLYGRGERRASKPEPRQRQPKRGRGAPSKLVLLDERGGRVSSHRLAGTVDIGRGPSAAIRPDDTYISTQHARVYSRNGSWVVEDLGSTNGTYLNQRKVTVPTEIAPGDRIRIGKTVIEVRK